MEKLGKELQIHRERVDESEEFLEVYFAFQTFISDFAIEFRPVPSPGRLRVVGKPSRFLATIPPRTFNELFITLLGATETLKVDVTLYDAIYIVENWVRSTFLPDSLLYAGWDNFLDTLWSHIE